MPHNRFPGFGNGVEFKFMATINHNHGTRRCTKYTKSVRGLVILSEVDHQLRWTFRGLLGTKEQTMKAKRKRHSAVFKAKVGFEALVGLKTVSQLAREYAVHPTQVTQWRATIRDHMPELVESGKPGTEDQEELIAQLDQKIGQLTVGLDWLKKSPSNWACSLPARTDRPRSADQCAASVRTAGTMPGH